ncbi:pentraxin-4 [Xenopus tropicalis]|uniref:Pentraxin-4 n=1 Tax=Xenopus tropicalis TaxID=8364 RepID=A0A6I8RTI6_XENTR|nr:pentraxin-4 [Xenopus tropicalis]
MFRIMVLTALCLQGVLLEQTRVLEQRKPFFERFRRLEEQFRRFQEITLQRLQGIAENYNLSYNIDARFQDLIDQQRSITEALNSTNEVNQREIDGVKFWLKKLQRKTKKLELKISSLEESLTQRNKQEMKDKKANDAVISNLTSAMASQKRLIVQLVMDKKALQKSLDIFQDSIQRQGSKITALEEKFKVMMQNEILPPSGLTAKQDLNRTPDKNIPGPPGINPNPITAQHRMAKLQSKHNQMKRIHEEQQLLIPSKMMMASMAEQHGAKNISFPVGEPQGNISKRLPEEQDYVTENVRLPKDEQHGIVTKNVGTTEEEFDYVTKNKRWPEEEQHDYRPTNPSLPEEEQHDYRPTNPSLTEEEQHDYRPTNPSLPEKEEPDYVTKNMRLAEDKEYEGVTGMPERESPEVQGSRPPSAVTETPRESKEQSTTVLSTKEQQTKKPGTICNVDSMLVFPNASTENFVTFSKGLRHGLHELSICSWVRTDANYLGTILSYATEENDNKLVLHGRNGAAYDALHFVIGDPVYRELPVVPFLDGNWHHTCFIWSAIQGKYWFYVDRRLASTGSRFQKGYEIPPGGSLVLGQEQDTLGGGFDSSEAFVGNLAGFAMWNRALTPGEVSGIVIGKGLPRGTIFTLGDEPSLHGSVQKVSCTCLEYCM